MSSSSASGEAVELAERPSGRQKDGSEYEYESTSARSPRASRNRSSSNSSSRRSRSHSSSRRHHRRSGHHQAHRDENNNGVGDALAVVATTTAADGGRRKAAQSAFAGRDSEASKRLHAATSVTEQHKKYGRCCGFVKKSF
jgi:hypothetical protein